MKKSKILSSLAIAMLFVVTSDCVSVVSVIYHDKTMNPCHPESPAQNAVECENWKKNYPKEYERYVKRIQREKLKKH